MKPAETLGSCIRSAAQATSSAYSRIPIRWRLAGGSALLTLVILLGFAVAVGYLTTRQVRADFNTQVDSAAERYASKLSMSYTPATGFQCRPDPDGFARADNAVIRVISPDADPICQTAGAPNFGVPVARTQDVDGYRVVSYRRRDLLSPETVIVQYARPLSAVENTAAKLRFLLAVGVIGGAALALLAGLAIARRAMAPITRLTMTARVIERTSDSSLRVAPHRDADDEVAELARTLDDMLRSLDRARAETEGMLARQREFVADASHELRTPLTSVLANLELLAEELEGEPRDTAASALRSSRRMRRLVADLLLLARADAGRASPRRPIDVGDVLVEAAAELEPVAGAHELSVEATPAMVDGARDELHRLALNLMENAIRHTPDATHVRASVARRDGAVAIAVEDDGPGIVAELRDRVFERFVRGTGDGRAGSGSGLGLSIVRSVAASHGGSVDLESPVRDGHGTRFVVRLPAAGGDGVGGERQEGAPTGASSAP